ncbi:MAG: zinc ribbon domain-containing protein [Phycisphaerales bacterium]|nr:zinc ribbon domain-containing protein [Phycisphaerales bacterium]
MMMAELGIAAVAFVALIGFFGFFLVIMTLMVKLVWRAMRGMFSLVDPHSTRDERAIGCPHVGCGHRNVKGARFCARCGRAIRATSGNTDVYG